jgi:hypothetical protein
VTQGEDGWLDLADYQDLIIWAQFTSFNSLTGCAIQTSPTRDEFFFQTMATITPSVGSAIVTQVLLWSAAIPLARFVRWQLTGTPTFDATFRLVVAANAEGL